MKRNADLLEIRADITSKVDNAVEYLIGVGNEINDELNYDIEKRMSKFLPNSEKIKEFETLGKTIDKKFANMHHDLYMSIGNLEKDVLEKLKSLTVQDPSYSDKVDKIMRNLDYSLEKEEGYWINKFEDSKKSYINKMDEILDKPLTIDNFSKFLIKPNTLLRKRDDLNFEMGKKNERKKSMEMQF